MIGSYEEVLVAANNPPVPYYSFFLSFLILTIRNNIAECIQCAYRQLTITEAVKLLMFNSKEVKHHINFFYSSII